MDVALTSLILISVLVLSVFTIAECHLSSVDAVLESWQATEERMEERARTDLSPVDAQTTDGGAYVEVTLRNDGDTRLADFDQWDVILEYDGSDALHYIEWCPYVEPGLFGLWQNKWTHYFSSDVFDPDILNPGEEVMIRISVDPLVKGNTTKQATIATPNGITASTVFTD